MGTAERLFEAQMLSWSTAPLKTLNRPGVRRIDRSAPILPFGDVPPSPWPAMDIVDGWDVSTAFGHRFSLDAQRFALEAHRFALPAHPARRRGRSGSRARRAAGVAAPPTTPGSQPRSPGARRPAGTWRDGRWRGTRRSRRL